MIKRRKSLLLAAGLLIISGSAIFNHYYPMTDFVRGISMGIGVGIMILSFYRKRSAAA
jgi:hypothetical protein